MAGKVSKYLQRIQDRKKRAQVVIELTEVSQAEKSKQLADLGRIPRRALHNFRDDRVQPQNWSELKMRVVVAKHMLECFEQQEEVDKIVADGVSAIESIRNRYYERDGLLKATPMEQEMLEQCLDLADEMQAQMEIGFLHYIYRKAQDELNSAAT